MEPEESLPHSQVLANCSYHEQLNPIHSPNIPHPDNLFYYHFPIYAWVYALVSAPPVSPPKPCTRQPLPNKRYMHRPSHSFRFYEHTILGEEYRTLSYSLCSVFHSLVISSLLCQSILLNTLCWNTLSLSSYLNTVLYTFKKMLCYCKVQMQKHMDRCTKCKAVTPCRDWPCSYYGQRTLKVQIFVVGYWSLRTESTHNQHCVQMCTDLPVGQGNCAANSHDKSQRDALFRKFIFDKELYMFRTDLVSIIRSLNNVYAATGICHASYVDCCR